MRAVLDTNVVMSAIFFGGVPLKIVRAAFANRVAEIFEIMDIALRRHRAKQRVPEKDVVCTCGKNIKVSRRSDNWRQEIAKQNFCRGSALGNIYDFSVYPRANRIVPRNAAVDRPLGQGIPDKAYRPRRPQKAIKAARLHLVCQKFFHFRTPFLWFRTHE